MSITPSPTPIPAPPAPAPVILECVAGFSADFPRATPNDDGSYGGLYAGTEPITCTIWAAGATGYALRQSGPPGNAWLDASKTEWLVRLDDAQTAAIGAGTFNVLVTAPLGPGRTGVLFDGQLQVNAGVPATHA